jgi:hypothetical protein
LPKISLSFTIYLMTELFFLARHVPFWGIPLIILGGEFGYGFWLKKKKKSAILSFSIAFLGLICVSLYYWAGGPEKSVKYIKVLHRDYLR